MQCHLMGLEGTKRVKHATTRSIEACSSWCKFPTLFRCFLTANALKISYSFRKENHRRRWYWKTTSAFPLKHCCDGTYLNEGYRSLVLLSKKSSIYLTTQHTSVKRHCTLVSWGMAGISFSHFPLWNPTYLSYKHITFGWVLFKNLA